MSRREEDEVWVPVTLHLPLGWAKGLSPGSCAPVDLFFGPFTLTMLYQTSCTVLTPVIPFLVTDMGANAVTYGMLQSCLWGSQTICGPMHGWISDRFGRKPVIVTTLFIMAVANAMLASATTVRMMFASRLLGGLGFQITLLKAYFADTAPQHKRTSSFGMIGVVQGFSLFAGPAIGGYMSKFGGRRTAVWFSAALCALGCLIALVWKPEQKLVPDPRSSAVSEPPSPHDALTEKDGERWENGVRMVKIDLTTDPAHPHGRRRSLRHREPEYTLDEFCCGGCSYLWSSPRLSRARKAYRFLAWLAGYDVYPLLTMNFVFRLSFAVYKSVFAFYCMSALGYGAAEVGAALSAMGIGGMFVQGALVRMVVPRLGEAKTLLLAMGATAAGFCLLSYARALPLFAAALTVIAIGYGLAVPCIASLFAAVPIQQGVMQGIGGAIDRFGQAIGPMAGGSMLHYLGEARLMRGTGLALALVSIFCLSFVSGANLFALCCCGARGGGERGDYSRVGTAEAEGVEIAEEEEEEAGGGAQSGGVNGWEVGEERDGAAARQPPRPVVAPARK